VSLSFFACAHSDTGAARNGPAESFGPLRQPTLRDVMSVRFGSVDRAVPSGLTLRYEGGSLALATAHYGQISIPRVPLR
jgi:hypothetical protein